MLVNAYDLLSKELRSIPYVELCEQTLELIECEPYSEQTNVEENFRSKLAYDRHGRFIVANGLVVLREWVEKSSQLCLPLGKLGEGVKPLILRMPEGCWEAGAAEAKQIRNKSGFANKFNKTPEEHARRANLGYSVERCVKDWFMDNFSEYYRQPMRGVIAAMDFSLLVNGIIFEVDVKSSTPGFEGSGLITFDALASNRYYIFAELLNEEEIAVRGWLPGRKVMVESQWKCSCGYSVPYKEIHSMAALIFRINCAKYNIDHRIFRRQIKAA